MALQELDGSILEGGGQVMRNGVALAVLHGFPVRVFNIRANRRKPGLQAQHLTGLELVASLCGGRLEGGSLQSSEITLTPGRIAAGHYSADTRTAGSTTLLLQAALPCLLFADGESSLTLRGGTNADLAPQIDYVTEVFRPMAMRLCGIAFDVNVQRRGYYPTGLGSVHVRVEPCERITPFSLIDRGMPIAVHVRIIVGNLPKSLGQQMKRGAEAVLRAPGSPVELVPMKFETIDDRECAGHGSSIIISTETSTGCIIAGSAVGLRGRLPSDVGAAAALDLLANLAHGGCVDEHLQDQLILFMALANGMSQLVCGPVSMHTQTAIYFAQRLTGAVFEVKRVDETRNLITCNGVGYVRGHE